MDPSTSHEADRTGGLPVTEERKQRRRAQSRKPRDTVLFVSALTVEAGSLDAVIGSQTVMSVTGSSCWRIRDR